MRLRYFGLGFVSILIGFVYVGCGTNTTFPVSPGLVRTTHVNQFFQALSETLVPRNSSGVPTDLGGDLGTSALRWNTLYIKTLVSSDAFPRSNLSSLNYQVSTDSSTFSCTSGTCPTMTAVTNLSVTIVTTGHPVKLQLLGGNNEESYVGHTAVGTTVEGFLQFWKDGATSVDIQKLKSAGSTADGTSGATPCSSFSTVDATPTAASHTYSVRVRVNANNISVFRCRLFVSEM